MPLNTASNNTYSTNSMPAFFESTSTIRYANVSSQMWLFMMNISYWYDCLQFICGVRFYFSAPLVIIINNSLAFALPFVTVVHPVRIVIEQSENTLFALCGNGHLFVHSAMASIRYQIHIPACCMSNEHAWYDMWINMCCYNRWWFYYYYCYYFCR